MTTNDRTGQQPAQPGSGEVKRYTPNSIANEIMAEDAWHDSQWVRAADYDRLKSALAAAQAENRTLRNVGVTMQEQLDAAQQRIRDLEHQLAVRSVS